MRDRTVLILDDEPFIRMNLATFLEDEGFRVLESPSAEHALQLLDEHPVGLVVVDLRLPGIDGESFIRRASLMDKGLRFVIHTGSIEYRLDDSLKSLGLTSSDIFSKPVKDMLELSEAIAERLSPRLEFA
jgi:DNA-binding NtrC family response regulator